MRLSLQNICDVLADRLIGMGYRATSGVKGSACWVKVMVSDRCVMRLNSVSGKFGKIAIEGYVKCGMVRAVADILTAIDAPCVSESGCWSIVRYMRVK